MAESKGLEGSNPVRSSTQSAFWLTGYGRRNCRIRVRRGNTPKTGCAEARVSGLELLDVISKLKSAKWDRL
jgi:hypothetical protein